MLAPELGERFLDVLSGVVRTRVTRSLRTCEEDLKHPRVGTIMMELKKEIMKTIREMTKNTGGKQY